jgi:hypothetical protein
MVELVLRRGLLLIGEVPLDNGPVDAGALRCPALK